MNLINVMNDFSSPKYDEHRMAVERLRKKDGTGILLNITASMM